MHVVSVNINALASNIIPKQIQTEPHIPAAFVANPVLFPLGKGNF